MLVGLWAQAREVIRRDSVSKVYLAWDIGAIVPLSHVSTAHRCLRKQQGSLDLNVPSWHNDWLYLQLALFWRPQDLSPCAHCPPMEHSEGRDTWWL